nr:MAG TPA: hypothetical protein [Caudoviricetes sp.]
MLRLNNRDTMRLWNSIPPRRNFMFFNMIRIEDAL